MIVRNEAPIILRCLESVRPLIDYVLVEDTGSTDGTQAIIRDYLGREQLPGLVFQEGWQNFGHNWSVAMARMRRLKSIDYVLGMAADDVLVLDDKFDAPAFKANLTAQLYGIEVRMGSIKFHRPQLGSNRVKFRCRGVLHEFIESRPDLSWGVVAGAHIKAGAGESARSRNPDKYRRDAELLERALRTEKDRPVRARYIFYLAQSYRDFGDLEKALSNYLRRARLGGWMEEVFVSLLNAARLQEETGRSFDEAMGTYIRAIAASPARAEALHGASRLCRKAGRYQEGFDLARRAATLVEPPLGLFVEPWIYRYGVLEELALNAYWAGRYEISLAIYQRLLSGDRLPLSERARVLNNAKFALGKLREQSRHCEATGRREAARAAAPGERMPDKMIGLS